MNESVFGTVPAADDNYRQPIGSADGRYVFFKVRLHGKLHFEKRPAPDYVGDLTTLEALRKEFELGYGLDHPGIVRYLKIEGDSIFEEYVDGLTLRQMIQQGDARLRNEAFLRQLCRQLLEALDYMHSKGILHLDIKPENVMIPSIGSQAKIIDLGSARSAQHDRSEGFTPAYMAPEQAWGAPTGPTTDIFLLGRLMAELTAGNPLWADFIARATDPQPSRRFQNCRQAIKGIYVSSKKDSGGKGCLKIIAWIGIIIAAIGWWSDYRETHPSTPAQSEFEIGAKLLRGNPTAEERADAMKWMLMAAEGGSIDAQCYLGFAYLEGIPPISPDTTQALHWLRMAAHRGDTLARRALDNLHPLEAGGDVAAEEGVARLGE